MSLLALRKGAMISFPRNKSVLFLASLAGLALGIKACSKGVDVPPKLTNADKQQICVEAGDDWNSKTLKCTTYSGSTFKLCNAIYKNEVLGEDPFKALVSALCYAEEGELYIDTIRGTDYVYTGGESGMIIGANRATTKSGKVYSTLYTSNKQTVPAAKYYAMKKLEFFQPTEFATNYTAASGLTMLTLSSATDDLRYRSTNVRITGYPRIYDGRMRFFALKESKAYVIATQMESSGQNVTAHTGLTIIHQMDDGTTLEVFTIAKEVHATSTDKTEFLKSLQGSMAADQSR
jgi:hypothetical protein